MVLAAHRIHVEVRRLFASECDESGGSFSTMVAQQSAGFDQNRNGGGIVIGTGSAEDSVVVGAEQNDLIGSFGTRTLDDQIGRLVAHGVVAFPRMTVSHLGPLTFDVADRGLNCFRLAQGARTDQSRKPIDMQSQILLDRVAVD